MGLHVDQGPQPCRLLSHCGVANRGNAAHIDVLRTALSKSSFVLGAVYAIEAGNAYVNIHDSAFPGEEIRG